MLINYPQKDIINMVQMIEKKDKPKNYSNRLISLDSRFDLKEISRSMKLSSM